MNIYDIAKAAGVSSATVSRVINGSPKVKPETAEHVRDVMNSLSFTPNIFARSLQSNSMQVLTVLTVDISDVYFAEAVQEIETYSRSRGYDIQVSFAKDDPDDQINRIRSLLSRRVDGIILAGSTFAHPENPYIHRVAQRTPVVLLNGRIDGEQIYSVVSDDGLGVEMAVDHLVELGRRNLLYVEDNSNAASLAKARGFATATARHGIDPSRIVSKPGVTGAEAALREAFDQVGPIDGIVAAEDPLGIGVIKFLHERGLRIPEDVAVTGYDNLSYAVCSTPELTSVDGRVRDVSRTVAKVLIDALEGLEAPKLTEFTPELVIRASTLGR